MATIEDLLEDVVKEIKEVEGAAVVNLESGLPIASFSVSQVIDIAVAAASYAEVVKANEKALELLGGVEKVGETEDILITTTRVYILIRKLGQKHYYGIALNRGGNLGFARVIMKKHEVRLLEALKELGEI